MARRNDGETWHRGLDRDAVVAAALRLLDEEGRDALTMRRLATELRVEAASLYAHVAGKDDLVDAVLDSVLDGIELPPPGRDPRAGDRRGLHDVSPGTPRPPVDRAADDRARPVHALAGTARDAVDHAVRGSRPDHRPGGRRARDADRLRARVHPPGGVSADGARAGPARGGSGAPAGARRARQDDRGRAVRDGSRGDPRRGAADAGDAGPGVSRDGPRAAPCAPDGACTTSR